MIVVRNLQSQKRAFKGTLQHSWFRTVDRNKIWTKDRCNKTRWRKETWCRCQWVSNSNPISLWDNLTNIITFKDSIHLAICSTKQHNMTHILLNNPIISSSKWCTWPLKDKIYQISAWYTVQTPKERTLCRDNRILSSSTITRWTNNNKNKVKNTNTVKTMSSQAYKKTNNEYFWSELLV